MNTFRSKILAVFLAIAMLVTILPSFGIATYDVEYGETSIYNNEVYSTDDCLDCDDCIDCNDCGDCADCTDCASIGCCSDEWVWSIESLDGYIGIMPLASRQPCTGWWFASNNGVPCCPGFPTVLMCWQCYGAYAPCRNCGRGEVNICRGNLPQPANLAISTTPNTNFGDWELGTTVPYRTVTVRNSGGSATGSNLNLTINNDNFELVGWTTGTLAAGASRTATLRPRTTIPVGDHSVTATVARTGLTSRTVTRTINVIAPTPPTVDYTWVIPAGAGSFLARVHPSWIPNQSQSTNSGVVSGRFDVVYGTLPDGWGVWRRISDPGHLPQGILVSAMASPAAVDFIVRYNGSGAGHIRYIRVTRSPRTTPTDVVTPGPFVARIGQPLSQVTLPANWTWDAPTTPIVAPERTATFPATYQRQPAANYNPVTRDVTVVIAAADTIVFNWGNVTAGSMLGLVEGSPRFMGPNHLGGSVVFFGGHPPENPWGHLSGTPNGWLGHNVAHSHLSMPPYLHIRHVLGNRVNQNATDGLHTWYGLITLDNNHQTLGVNVPVLFMMNVTDGLPTPDRILYVTSEPSTNFGDWRLGTDRPERTITVTNFGNTEIPSPINLTIDNANFELIGWNTGALAPGESRTAILRPISAAAVGTHDVTVTASAVTTAPVTTSGTLDKSIRVIHANAGDCGEYPCECEDEPTYGYFGWWPQSAAGTTTPAGTGGNFADWNGNPSWNWVRLGTRYFYIEPIRWRVLEVENGRALVLSEEILDQSRWHASSSLNWEVSELRTWGHTTFFNNAFTATEQAAVMSTNNPGGGTSSNNATRSNHGGADTVDYVFALSFGQVNNTAWFPNIQARYTTVADFANARGARRATMPVGGPGYRVGDWWTRSPGNSATTASAIFDLGSIQNASVTGSSIGTRPAMNMDVNYLLTTRPDGRPGDCGEYPCECPIEPYVFDWGNVARGTQLPRIASEPQKMAFGAERWEFVGTPPSASIWGAATGWDFSLNGFPLLMGHAVGNSIPPNAPLGVHEWTGQITRTSSVNITSTRDFVFRMTVVGECGYYPCECPIEPLVFDWGYVERGQTLPLIASTPSVVGGPQGGWEFVDSAGPSSAVWGIGGFIMGPSEVGDPFQIRGHDIAGIAADAPVGVHEWSGRVRVRWHSGTVYYDVTFRMTVVGECGEYPCECDNGPFVATVASAQPLRGSAAGGGEFMLGDTVNIVATPASGYIFTHWSVLIGDAVLTNATQANTSFAMPSGPVLVVANFERFGGGDDAWQMLTLTRNNNAWGTVNGTNVVNGTGLQRVGATVAIQAIPEAGYRFVNWTTSSPNVVLANATNAITTFVMPSNDVTIQANFEQIGDGPAFGVVVDVYDPDRIGMGRAFGGGSFAAGSTVAVYAVPNLGFRFVRWEVLVGGVSVANVENATFTMPNQAVMLRAHFEQDPNFVVFPVLTDVNNEAWGVANGWGSFAAGATVTIEAVANPGYRFIGWTVARGGVTLTNSTLPTTTFVMPSEPVRVIANFERDTGGAWRLLTVTSNSLAMGSVSGGGIFPEGATVSIAAVPNEGYRFIGWTVTSPSGLTLANSTVANTTLVMPVGSGATVVAHFERMWETPPTPEFTLTLEANPEVMGRVNGAGIFGAGARVAIQAVPNPGFVFVNWTVVSPSGVVLDSLTNASTMFTMPNGHVTLRANFVLDDGIPGNRFTVTVENGTVGENGATSGMFAGGSTVEVRAAVPASYVFRGWEVVTANTAVMNVNAPITTFIMPNANVTVRAILEYTGGPGPCGNNPCTCADDLLRDINEAARENDDERMRDLLDDDRNLDLIDESGNLREDIRDFAPPLTDDEWDRIIEEVRERAPHGDLEDVYNAIRDALREIEEERGNPCGNDPCTCAADLLRDINEAARENDDERMRDLLDDDRNLDIIDPSGDLREEVRDFAPPLTDEEWDRIVEEVRERAPHGDLDDVRDAIRDALREIEDERTAVELTRIMTIHPDTESLFGMTGGYFVARVNMGADFCADMAHNFALVATAPAGLNIQIHHSWERTDARGSHRSNENTHIFTIFAANASGAPAFWTLDELMATVDFEFVRVTNTQPRTPEMTYGRPVATTSWIPGTSTWVSSDDVTTWRAYENRWNEFGGVRSAMNTAGSLMTGAGSLTEMRYRTLSPGFVDSAEYFMILQR